MYYLKYVLYYTTFFVKYSLNLVGQPTPEFIKLLSSLTADHYGPPLTGYPGTSGNNTSKQMIEGVMSTVSFETPDSRSFVHIKVHIKFHTKSIPLFIVIQICIFDINYLVK